MKPNCRGCKEEFKQAYQYQKEGLFFAGSGIGERGHIRILMVDYRGEVVIWYETA